MKILDPGHKYRLFSLDDPEEIQLLHFVKREGAKYPGNVGQHAGTNIQDVLRALIDRLKYLDNQIPCLENKTCQFLLRQAILMLEIRASRRHGRVLSLDRPGGSYIEDVPFCQKCGHIGCAEECHE